MAATSKLPRVAAWLTALTMWAFATSKLLGGPVPGSLLEGTTAWIAVITVEFAIGPLVVRPRTRLLGAIGVLAFVAVAVLLVFLADKPCGCAGPGLTMDTKLRLSVAMFLGALASLCLAPAKTRGS